MYIVVNSNLTWWLFKGFRRWEPPKSCIVISEVDLAMSSTNLSFDIPLASAAANSLLLKVVLNAGTISPASVEYSPWWNDVLFFRTLGDFLFDDVAVVFYGMANIFLASLLFNLSNFLISNLFQTYFSIQYSPFLEEYSDSRLKWVCIGLVSFPIHSHRFCILAPFHCVLLLRVRKDKCFLSNVRL